MLLDCGKLNEALDLDAKLLESPPEGWDNSFSGNMKYEEKLLSDLELDCIAIGGPDVGCGIQISGAAKYSQQTRKARDEFIADFLRSFPSKKCDNCMALSLQVRKDGYTKFFQRPLRRNQKATMDALNISYESAVRTLRSRAVQAAKSISAGGEKTSHYEDALKNYALPEVNFDQDEEPSTLETPEASSESEDFSDSSSVSDDEGAAKEKPKYMPPSEVSAQMLLLWEKESEVLRRIFLPVRSTGKLARKKNHNLAETEGEGQSLVDGYGGKDGWKHFFFRVIPVTPARFRPPTRLGERQFEHPQNVYLSKIITLSNALLDLGLGSGKPSSGKGGVDLRQAISIWMDLQNNINGLMDSSKAPTVNGVEAANGIRQLLERKEGMFRMNMMGKRVNYAARTVISPDPCLRVDEVGVPLRFAKRLSFKQAVTPFNVHELRKAVINGAHVWPGATHVEDERGVVTDLSRLTRDKREAIAKTLLAPSASSAYASAIPGVSSSASTGVPSSVTHPLDVDSQAVTSAAAPMLGGVGIKRVWRHLKDGDPVLMNRQPSLHKASIMAHRVRVMKNWGEQKIFRFHYANCKAYNADFDGDEMNMHLPQDFNSLSEAYHIMDNANQYLSACGGEPLRGLIQDHNAIVALLTQRDRFLTKDQFCQLLYSGLQAIPAFGVGANRDGFGASLGASTPLDITIPEPAILKPQPLWTGKQIVSSLLAALSAHLPNHARQLNYDGRAKIGDGIWGKANGAREILPVSDAVITVRKNELLTGVLDKNALGNSSYGLIHAVYETYGPQAAGTLLSAFGRLLTVYLHFFGMTCGMDDLVLTKQADEERTKLLKKGTAKGYMASASFAGEKDTPEDLHDKLSKSFGWNRHIRRRIRDKLRGGAAGVDVTGQAAMAASVEFDNAVKGAMAKAHSDVIKTSLPYGLAKTFPQNQFSLMVTSGAKGSLVNHAMIAVGLGQQELEGRRVPMLSSGKTLPCFPPYDPSPRAGGYIADRFLTGLRPAEYFFHCMSGREGLVDTAVKTSRSGYLQRCLVKHLEELRIHYDGTVRDADGGLVQPIYGEDGLDVINVPYMEGKDNQLSFLAKNHGILSHAYGMATPAFARVAATLNTVDAPKMYQNLLILRENQKDVMPVELAKAVQATKGQKVSIRVPNHLPEAEEGASLDGSNIPGITVSARKAYDAKNLSTNFTEATIIRVRTGEDADSDVPSFDVRYLMAITRPMAKPSGVGKHASAKSAKASKKDAKSVPEEAADSATTRVTASKEFGVESVQVSVTIRKIPLVLATSKQAFAPVLVRVSLQDPITAKHRGTTHLGAISESLADRLANYAQANPDGLIRTESNKANPNAILSLNAFNALMWVKAMRSAVAPGEPVGVIAAQSIGEPSTQMTLNTFHLAGGGGVNVTLGIPRLREIVMTASPNPKTPQMALALLQDVDKNPNAAREIAARIARLLSPLPITDLLASDRPDGGITVSESLRPLGSATGKNGATMWVREYAVRYYLSDLEHIFDAFGLTFQHITEAFGSNLAPQLLRIIASDVRKTNRAAGANGAATVGVAAASKDAAPVSMDEDDDPTTRSAAALKKKKMDKEADIDESEDEEEEDGGDDEGTLRTGKAKDVEGYSDDDDEESIASDVNPTENALQSSDEDSDPGAVPPAPGSDKPKKGRLTSKKLSEDRAAKKLRDMENAMFGVVTKKAADGIVYVKVPSTLEQNARFGGVRACETGLSAEGTEANPWVEISIVFPASARKILMLHSAERAATVSMVRVQKGIDRAIVTRQKVDKDGPERTCVVTEGRNLKAMWTLATEMTVGNFGLRELNDRVSEDPVVKMPTPQALQGLNPNAPLVDINKLYTNDIAAMLHTYGVEAARASIVREMGNVFAAYGIGVDSRHLLLIADYMTQGGTFKAMNRIGMETHSSPFIKMSFETTAKFLTGALLNGERDRLVSPSSRIVLGRVVESGTGAFELVQPLNN